MQYKKTLLLVGASVALVLGFIVHSAEATALSWSNGAGDFGWSTSPGSLNWNGVSWSNGNDAVFGATGIGTVTLNTPVIANSLIFNTSGYTIAGGNTLTINSGGISTSVSESISAPIALGANQVWMVTGSSSSNALIVSGPISGTGGITFGAPVVTQSSSQFLTTSSTQVFVNTQLSALLSVSGKMGGMFVNNGTPVPANGYYLNITGTSALYQLQAVDSSYTKCVEVQLTQVGNNINAVEIYAKYIQNVNDLGVNFDSTGSTVAVATSQVSAGYGQATTVITMQAQAQANGTIILSGSNSYSGPTTIATGTLQIGVGDATGTPGSGSIADYSVLAFDRGDNALIVPNAISGSGAIIVFGAGMVTLTGSNSYSGSTTISAGTLQIGNGGSKGTLGTGSIVDNGVLKFSRSDNALVVSDAISGSGSIMQSGGGLMVLSGSNSFTGGTTITGGTLQLSGIAALGTGNVIVNGGSTLDLHGASQAAGAVNLLSGKIVSTVGSPTLFGTSYSVCAGTIGTRLGGNAAALTMTGSGVVALTGSNSYGGGTYVSSGTLVLSGATSLLAGSSLAIGNGTGAGAIFLPPVPSQAVTTELAPVPEPGTFISLVAGAALVVLFWSRLR